MRVHRARRPSANCRCCWWRCAGPSICGRVAANGTFRRRGLLWNDGDRPSRRRDDRRRFVAGRETSHRPRIPRDRAPAWRLRDRRSCRCRHWPHRFAWPSPAWPTVPRRGTCPSIRRATDEALDDFAGGWRRGRERDGALSLRDGARMAARSSRRHCDAATDRRSSPPGALHSQWSTGRCGGANRVRC